jgi:hypothetical protein
MWGDFRSCAGCSRVARKNDSDRTGPVMNFPQRLDARGLANGRCRNWRRLIEPSDNLVASLCRKGFREHRVERAETCQREARPDQQVSAGDALGFALLQRRLFLPCTNGEDYSVPQEDLRVRPKIFRCARRAGSYYRMSAGPIPKLISHDNSCVIVTSWSLTSDPAESIQCITFRNSQGLRVSNRSIAREPRGDRRALEKPEYSGAVDRCPKGKGGGDD